MRNPVEVKARIRQAFAGAEYPGERAAIAAYLACRLEGDDITGFERQSIGEALQSYWSP